MLTRDVIYDRIWGYDFETRSRSLDVYIGYLRAQDRGRRGGAPRPHRARRRLRRARAVSLRWRITLGLGLIAALVVIGGATAAYVTTRQRLAASLDESLRTTADRLPGVQTTGGSSNGRARRVARRRRLLPTAGVPAGSDLAPAVAAQRIDADGTVTVCIEGQAAIPVDARDRSIAAGGPAIADPHRAR